MKTPPEIISAIKAQRNHAQQAAEMFRELDAYATATIWEDRFLNPPAAPYIIAKIHGSARPVKLLGTAEYWRDQRYIIFAHLPTATSSAKRIEKIYKRPPESAKIARPFYAENTPEELKFIL